MLLGVLVVAGGLAFLPGCGAKKPAAVVKVTSVASSPASTNESAAASSPQIYKREFVGGSSLVWTAGTGGIVYISNNSPQLPLFKFLRSETWKASAVPLRFQYTHASQPELEQQRVMYLWSADTFDFGRPLPTIEFKDYK